ncbi:MAG TPA: hypothetical protein VJN95_01980, partial [Gemmatimonadales bacterium]|nr:hypothetical protein [Gemmatimonadales bacterium]
MLRRRWRRLDWREELSEFTGLRRGRAVRRAGGRAGRWFELRDRQIRRRLGGREELGEFAR